MSYYQRLNEFRNTDVRYIGSGGYHLARKEFGLNVGKRLDKYKIPQKDKIYLKYADERYKREKQSEIKAKQNQKEQQQKNPKTYKSYHDELLMLKYKYLNSGLNIKNVT